MGGSRGLDNSSKNIPRNVACPLTTPVSLFASSFLYASKLVKRIAIFGTMPVITAPSPLYRPSGVSFLTISAPVAMKPRLFTPGARARRESCMRTLIVSEAHISFIKRGGDICKRRGKYPEDGIRALPSYQLCLQLFIETEN